jgi:hypothetical protein
MGFRNSEALHSMHCAVPFRFACYSTVGIIVIYSVHELLLTSLA